MVDGACVTYEFWPSDAFQREFGLYLVFSNFLLPVFILIYCYCQILWILRQRITSGLDSGTSGSSKFQTAKTNVIKTLLIVVLFFFLCFASEETFYLLYNLGYEVDWDGVYYKFSVVMVFLNCTVNPFIYLFNYKDFQKALRNLFCGDGLQEEGQSQMQTTTTRTWSTCWTFF